MAGFACIIPQSLLYPSYNWAIWFFSLRNVGAGALFPGVSASEIQTQKSNSLLGKWRVYGTLKTATWMDLEGITLREISQRETRTIRFHFYVASKKNKRTTKTHTQENNLVAATGEGAEGTGEIGKEIKKYKLWL